MTKTEVEPHAQRRGWLKNGNPPGDFLAAPRCGAKSRLGHPCRQPAMKNGRCRLHGGKSTGPKTAKGKERSRRANLKHGYYTIESIQQRREFHQKLREFRKFLFEHQID